MPTNPEQQIPDVDLSEHIPFSKRIWQIKDQIIKWILLALLVAVIAVALIYAYKTYSVSQNSDKPSVSITAGNCPELGVNVDKEIEEANFCNTHDDCTPINFQCLRFINKQRADRVEYLINSYDIWCRSATLTAGIDCVDYIAEPYLMCRDNTCVTAEDEEHQVKLYTQAEEYEVDSEVQLILTNDLVVPIDVPNTKQIDASFARLFKQMDDGNWRLLNTFIPKGSTLSSETYRLLPTESTIYLWDQSSFWEGATAMTVGPGVYRLEFIFHRDKYISMQSNEFKIGSPAVEVDQSEVVIITDKEVYQPGKTVQITLTNRSEAVVNVMDTKYISEKISDLEKKTESGWEKVNLIPIADEIKERQLSTEATHTYSWNQKIFVIGTPGYPLTQPGVYRFKFFIKVGNVDFFEFYSNEFEIKSELSS